MELQKNNNTGDWKDRYEEGLLANCVSVPDWKRMEEKLKKAEKTVNRKPIRKMMLALTAAACICGFILLMPSLDTGSSIKNDIPVSLTNHVQQVKSNRMGTIPVAVKDDTPAALVKSNSMQQSSIIPVKDTALLMHTAMINDTSGYEQPAVAQGIAETKTTPAVIPLKIFNKHLADVFRHDQPKEDSTGKPYLRKYKVKSLTAPEQGRVYTNDHPIHSPFN